MMKLKLISLLALLMLLTACRNNSNKEVLNTDTMTQSSISTKTEQTDTGLIDDTTTASLDESDQEEYTSYESRYAGQVNNVLIMDNMLGGDILDQWLEDVYYKLDAKEREVTPLLYQLVEYFSISKEVFIEYNESGNYKFSDNVIEGLYASDINTMLEALVSPYAIYHDGMIYTIDALYEMSYDQIKAIGIPSKELGEYAEKMDGIFREEFNNGGYEKDYKEFFELLVKISGE